MDNPPQKTYSLPVQAVPQISVAPPVLQAQPIAAGAAQPLPKASSGFGLKAVLSLVAILAIGGIGAAGYIAAPETFYNTVGKYVGMAEPATSTVNDGDTKVAETGTTTRAVANVSTVDLVALLPGSDANLVVHFKNTPELTSVTDILKKILAEKFVDDSDVGSKDIEEKYSNFLQNVDEFVLGGKLDYRDYKAASTGTSTQHEIVELSGGNTVLRRNLTFGFTLAIKPVAGQGQAVLSALSQIVAPNRPTDATGATSAASEFEQQENGVIVWKDENGLLNGQLSESALMQQVQNSQENFALALDTKDLISDLANYPMFMISEKRVALFSKIQSLSLNLSTAKDGEKYNLLIAANMKLVDFQAATSLFNLLKPEFEKAELMVPMDYSSFLTTSFVQNLTDLDLQASVKDLAGLVDKLAEATQKAQQMQQEKLKKLYEEEEKKLDEAQQTLDDMTKKEEAAKAAGRVLRPKVK